MDFTRVVAKIANRYLVPRHHAFAAFRAIHRLLTIWPTPTDFEVRTVARKFVDEPCYRQTCVGIHFTWKKNWSGRRVLPLVEEHLSPLMPAALG